MTKMAVFRSCWSFGSLLPGRNYSSGSYRFGFNGQEKVDEVNGSTGTHNTALFWEYDTRTGRRWNLDPKPQIRISDYAVMGLNPVHNMDILGDTWKEGTGSDKKAASMTKTAEKKEAKYRKDAANLMAKATKLTAAGKTEGAAGLIERAEDAVRGADEMASAQAELAQMGASTTVFEFQQRIIIPGTTTQVSHTYMASDGTVVMPWVTEGNAFHEAKHGWQHLNGNLELLPGTGGTAKYADLGDEQEAYRREYFVNAGGVSALSKLQLRNSADITTQWVKSIQLITEGRIVRPYVTHPVGPLNKPGSPAAK